MENMETALKSMTIATTFIMINTRYFYGSHLCELIVKVPHFKILHLLPISSTNKLDYVKLYIFLKSVYSLKYNIILILGIIS